MPAEADAVFAIVGDLDRLPEWMPAPIGVRPTGDGEVHADVESRDVHADGLVGVRPEQLRAGVGQRGHPRLRRLAAGRARGAGALVGGAAPVVPRRPAGDAPATGTPPTRCGRGSTTRSPGSNASSPARPEGPAHPTAWPEVTPRSQAGTSGEHRCVCQAGPAPEMGDAVTAELRGGRLDAASLVELAVRRLRAEIVARRLRARRADGRGAAHPPVRDQPGAAAGGAAPARAAGAGRAPAPARRARRGAVGARHRRAVHPARRPRALRRCSACSAAAALPTDGRARAMARAAVERDGAGGGRGRQPRPRTPRTGRSTWRWCALAGHQHLMRVYEPVMLQAAALHGHEHAPRGRAAAGDRGRRGGTGGSTRRCAAATWPTIVDELAGPRQPAPTSLPELGRGLRLQHGA